jgi:nucleotide-binding universal stress UspA family protein
MKTITKIVVPVDLEEHTQKLVEYAAYMAEKLAADLYVIHVVEPFRAVGDMDLGAVTVREYHQNRIKHAKDFLGKLIEAYPNCKSAKVIDGDIVDEIVSFAEEEEASLIVIGTHGSKGLEKLLLGSVAERVVKRAHCPTLVMNPFK